MKLSEVRQALNTLENVRFALPSGELVPAHFHVTEVGHVRKHYIDCGGTVRDESTIAFQLYTASDYDHRLGVQKLQSIIDMSVNQLSLPDVDVKVEYQGASIEIYDLAFAEGVFNLIPTETNCLAKDKCGIPETKKRVKLSTLGQASNTCKPGSGCC